MKRSDSVYECLTPRVEGKVPADALYRHEP